MVTVDHCWLSRVSLLLIVVCFISSALFGLFISLVGVLSESCGRHGNFSSVLSNVVDQPQSWGNTYPLGGLLLENTSFPLTLAGSIDRCRDNQSLYRAIRLDARNSLSDIEFSAEVSGCGY